MIPNLRRAVRGWTSKETAFIITDSVDDDGKKAQSKTDATIEVNIQPMPPEQIRRKPEEQWSWQWVSLIVISGPELPTDGAVVIRGVRYRIEKKIPWDRSGFRKYEAVEDYDYTIEEIP